MGSEVRILSGAMLLETYCSGPALTNGILLACMQTHKAAIIDAPQGSAQQLIDRVKELGLEVEYLLLTHSHWDHTADAEVLKRELNIPLYVHKLDAKNVEEPGYDGLPLLIEIPKAKVDHFLEEGQSLKLGELTIQVLHTPGHSPGGVCFYLKEQNTLISGDTLFQGSIGNLSLPTSEPEKMWPSLEKLAKLPPNTRVIPGHGDETNIGDEEWLPNAKQYFGG
ncbi:MAG: MBL fold metallo-hydrolase [Simkaniaceae bacterium]|nr:MBL fold metallo-hydrolase [Candidatus Sacchlamyda saccharinae]